MERWWLGQEQTALLSRPRTQAMTHSREPGRGGCGGARKEGRALKIFFGSKKVGANAPRSACGEARRGPPQCGRDRCCPPRRSGPACSGSSAATTGGSGARSDGQPQREAARRPGAGRRMRPHCPGPSGGGQLAPRIPGGATPPRSCWCTRGDADEFSRLVVARLVLPAHIPHGEADVFVLHGLHVEACARAGPSVGGVPRSSETVSNWGGKNGPTRQWWGWWSRSRRA